MGFTPEELEKEFIERTLEVLTQYDNLQIDEKHKYEVTLFVNSLLGLVIVPKEKGLLSYLPCDRIEELSGWGLNRSQVLNPNIKTIKDLMIALRQSAAHFDIAFESNGNNKIQTVIFSDNYAKRGQIARFGVVELRTIIENVAKAMLANYAQHHSR